MVQWKQRFRFWVGGFSTLPFLVALSVLVGLLILYACQDSSEITQPSALTSATTHKLTILAAGNGSGKVTSSPTGISCTITLGVTGSSGCTKAFDAATTVTLQPAPLSGHAFAGWSSNTSTCAGTGTCKVKMGVDRTVTARFNKGPFTIRISSVAPSGGTGKVKLQVGTTAKTCTITNGTPESTTLCSISAAAYQTVTLTPTPASGLRLTGGTCPHAEPGNVSFAPSRI